MIFPLAPIKAQLQPFLTHLCPHPHVYEELQKTAEHSHNSADSASERIEYKYNHVMFKFEDSKENLDPFLQCVFIQRLL